VTVTAGAENQQVWIEIADTGIGIAAQDLPMVFETFWRKDDAHKTPGFGMGLSIARLVIDNHAGKIELNSQPGVGTQVRITLPLA
jgi:signal transduction histidine kinase